MLSERRSGCIWALSAAEVRLLVGPSLRFPFELCDRLTELADQLRIRLAGEGLLSRSGDYETQISQPRLTLTQQQGC